MCSFNVSLTLIFHKLSLSCTHSLYPNLKPLFSTRIILLAGSLCLTALVSGATETLSVMLSLDFFFNSFFKTFYFIFLSRLEFRGSCVNWDFSWWGSEKTWEFDKGYWKVLGTIHFPKNLFKNVLEVLYSRTENFSSLPPRFSLS